MIYRILADFVVAFHGAYVVFVVLGALLAFKWPKILWVHAPAAIWGILIEYAGWVCPLTPLENHLRALAGEAGYAGDFIEHYILRALYPHGLTPTVRYVLGTFALGVNVVAYTMVIKEKRKARRALSSA
ncbi:MAG TPA: DUF2784 domain-containing protein [Gemmatimonadaceae bacterium]|jgi:hypothetical protein